MIRPKHCLPFVFLILLMPTAQAYDNVLIFTIDTLRADALACYGGKTAKTPNIDALAATGVMFRDTVSQAPFTLPSHVTILTGLIPPAHGVQDNGGFYLDSRVTTLAEVFKARGFHTAAFVGAFPLDSRFGLDQGFDLYDDSYPAVGNVSEITMPERRGEEVTASALKWLQTQTTNHWFAWIHYYDPHFPYRPPAPYSTSYSTQPYAGEVAYADEQVGRILKFLKDNSLDQKTLVVLTGDHGEALGEHREKTHGIFAYESTLRVPLIVAPAAHRVVERRVRSVDIAPTVLDLMETSFSGKIQGKSLRRLLEGHDEDLAPDDSYFEALSMYLNAGWAPLRGFYSGNYKYIELPIRELYDVSRDAGETTNLCSDNALCDKWQAKFESYFRPYRKPVAPTKPVDAETAEQLRALGYVSGSSSGGGADKKFGPEDDPKNLIPLHFRVEQALSWFNKGYDLKALEILEKLIEEKPGYSVAYLHAAFIYSSGGFPDKAVDTLTLAIKNGITGADVFGKLGVYLYESGKYAEAIKDLRIAIKEDEKDLDNLNYLGMSFTAAGQYAEAENCFKKALAQEPTDATTLSNLGTLYLTQKKSADAITQFQAAIAANPRIAGAYNGLGVIYAGQKNWNEAIRYWTLSVDANDSNYDALLNLAYAYLELNNKEKALELFQRFQKNAPQARYGTDLARVREVIRRLQ